MLNRVGHLSQVLYDGILPLCLVLALFLHSCHFVTHGLLDLFVLLLDSSVLLNLYVNQLLMLLKVLFDVVALVIHLLDLFAQVGDL